VLLLSGLEIGSSVVVVITGAESAYCDIMACCESAHCRDVRVSWTPNLVTETCIVLNPNENELKYGDSAVMLVEYSERSPPSRRKADHKAQFC
jgi:hypothetical protein